MLSRTTGKHDRLSTELEWEFVAWAGRRTSRHCGDDPTLACKCANVHDETTQHSRRFTRDTRGFKDGLVETATVVPFKPNPFAQHDVAGNVWEGGRRFSQRQRHERPPLMSRRTSPPIAVAASIAEKPGAAPPGCARPPARATTRAIARRCWGSASCTSTEAKKREPAAARIRYRANPGEA